MTCTLHYGTHPSNMSDRESARPSAEPLTYKPKGLGTVSTTSIPDPTLKLEKSSSPAGPGSIAPSFVHKDPPDPHNFPSLSAFDPVSEEPPINKPSLSELDDEHLANHLLLRHDLNFDPKIQFRPTAQGFRCEQRISKTEAYWNAVHTEIAGLLFDENNDPACESCDTCCWMTVPLQSDRATPGNTLTWLPRMLEAIFDILGILIPEPEWSAIDACLDINLLTQQIEKGVCDFVAFGEWLGNLLQRFSSRERHHLIHGMAALLRTGVHTANVHDIILGLRRLFDILEIMKLVRSRSSYAQS